VKVTTSTQPTARRIVSVIPLADLEREQLQDLSDELGEPLDEPSIAAIADSSSKAERASGITQRFSANPNPPPLLQPQPETQPSGPAKSEPEYVRLAREERELMLEQSEMPAKKSKKPRVYRGDEVRYAAIARLLHLEPRSKTGEMKRVGAQMGIAPNLLSKWLMDWRASHGNEMPPGHGHQKTLVSASGVQMKGAPSAPVSGPVSVSNGQLPPPPTVVLAGLEEYIKALVAHQVAAEFRRRLQGMAE